MSDLDQTIRRDLTRKIETRIEEVMRRELAIAQAVLPADEVVIMYLEIAAHFASCAVGSGCSPATPGSERERSYGALADAMRDAVLRRRDVVLAAIARKEAA